LPLLKFEPSCMS